MNCKNNSLLRKYLTNYCKKKTKKYLLLLSFH